MAQPPSAAVADRRRQDLLEAAFALIGEKGLEGLRTRDIVARAGLSIAMLHYYFGTKEALLVAVVDHTAAKFTEPREGPGAWPPSLETHLAQAWDSFRAHPHLSVVLQELALRAHRDPATRAAFEVLFAEWNGLVEQILRAEVASGLRSEQLDPHLGAILVTSWVMGAMTQRGVDPAAFDLEEVGRELDRRMR